MADLTKKKWPLIAFSVLMILIAGLLFAWWTVDKADSERRAELLLQSSLVAKAVELDRVQTLSGTEADLDSLAYQRLKDQFTAVRSAQPLCRFIYLLGRKADGTVFIFVDSEAADSPDYSPPGQIYEEVSAVALRVFETRTMAVGGPDTDRWGTWVSGLVPLIDPKTGAVIAVLGIDIDARDWHWGVAGKAALPVGMMLMMLFGVAATITYFTKRKQMEMVLKESENSFRTLFEQAAVGVAKAEADTGQFIRVNQKFCAIIGYSADELLGRNFQAITHPEDLGGDLGKMKLLRAGEIREFTIEKRYLHKSGSAIWVALTVSPLWQPGDQPDYVIGVAQDITERKKTEQALRKSEALYRNLVEHSPMGMHFYELDPQERLIFKGANPSADQLLGMQHALLVDKSIEEAFPGIVETEMAGHYRLAAREGIDWITEHIDYQDHRIAGAFEIRAFQTSPGQMVAVFMDISNRLKAETEKIEMERRLFHSQKLESLGLLAGGIAHDFNNLLASMLGNLDLAMMRISPISPARNNIEQAIQAIRRASDLTRQMLAYSGRGHFLVQTINLTEMVKENAHLLQAAMPKNVSFKLQLGHDLPPVLADIGQVQQVIMNLITNAAEAIGETTGIVTLKTSVLEADANLIQRSRTEIKPPPGWFVCLEVTDSGCGMDQETLNCLFDPFFTTKFTGRGLGMAAVLGIVRGHQGAIIVDSEEGRGTTFQILLPVSPETKVEAGDAGIFEQTVAQLDQAKISGTILVVDDEGYIRSLVREVLELRGLTVLEAENGWEALEIFSQRGKEIECVLLDLTMPRMDGLQTFENLKKLRPEVKVILSSGFAEEEATLNISRQDLAGFIQKPFQLENLCREVERVMRKDRQDPT